MYYPPETKNIDEMLERQEIEDMKEYCKSQGFSEKQTQKYIENSLKSYRKTCLKQ